MFSIEFPASINGNSAAFNAVYHCTVVWNITFGFFYMYLTSSPVTQITLMCG